ncbi:response regulator transcription factor [Enterobacteriaceae bacterium BIT-l23]|uniref:LuxR C-terminal-related transcriptional regulator n=1 Tax=Jejubacter sp. L23 TaxID=3092086 RepID=UPI0015848FDB|nr:response regulator transcription factor [Enterobacteriaceae bacterium BIT-l23]
MSKFCIAIAQDLYLRRGIREIICQNDGIRCYSLKKLAELPDMMLRETPEILILDHIPLTRQEISILDRFRRQAPDIRLVAICGASYFMFSRAIRMGFHGYLSITAPLPEAIHAISLVKRGGGYLSPDILQHYQRYPTDNQYLSRLTSREIDVLQGFMRGMDSRTIALELEISDKTISVIKNHIMLKLQAPNLVSMLDIAWRNHLNH